MRKYYRGDYGDTQPQAVIAPIALDFDGRLRQHYYKTEAEAWAAILGSAAESAEHAESRYKKLYAALEAATADMARRRATQRDVTRNYEAWRLRATA